MVLEINFLKNIPLSYFYWLYPILFVLILVFAYYYLKKQSPKPKNNLPLEFNTYSYIYVVKSKSYDYKPIIDHAIIILTYHNFLSFDNQGKYIKFFSQKKTEKEIDQLDPFEKYVYNRIEPGGMTYRKILQFFHEFDVSGDLQFLLEPYEQKWINAGYVNTKSFKLQQRLKMFYLITFLGLIGVFRVINIDFETTGMAWLVLLFVFFFSLPATNIKFGTISVDGKKYIEKYKAKYANRDEIKESEFLSASAFTYKHFSGNYKEFASFLQSIPKEEEYYEDDE